MATSATSPLASPPASSTPTVTSPPTEHSSPSPNPSTNGNPPEPSPISPPPPPPTPVASPPTDSPPPAPVELPPSSPPPPPPPAISPTHPATITPSPSPPPPTSSPPLPIQFTPPPPPSSPPPPPSLTPPMPSLPSDPPSSPPPPSSNPPLSSPSVPAHSSPPPPAPRSKPPITQPPPPHISHQTPPSPNKPTGSPPLAAQPPKNSPSAPVQYPPTPSPSKNTTSSPSYAVSSLHPSSSSPGSFVSSSPSSTSAKSTADSLDSGKGGVPMGGIVAIGLVLGFVMLGVIGLLALYMSKRKRREFKHNGGHIVPSPFGSSPRSNSNLIVKTTVSSSTPFVRSTSGSGTLSPHSHGGLGQSRSWFTYQELYEATNGFSLEDLLGEGGFGCVYKGDLANGREVAVKQLKIGASQGEREFQAEVEIISRIHHKHLVSLVGYCISESKRLLVYEYVPNQTLYYHLHGDNRPVMDWAIRIKIVVGAARGIAYLHEDCHPRIIHRDIKSSNILLDDKLEARLQILALQN